MIDIVEELRYGHEAATLWHVAREAADTIEALRAENARLYEWKDKAGDMDRVKTVELVDLRAENAKLREALKPFDRECKRLVANYHRPETQMRPAITAGELRAARAAMGESDE